MKNRSHAITVTSLAFLFLVPPAKAANEPVIEAKQQHYYFGNMVAFIGKNELRLDNLGSFKFVLCSRAPKWDVIVYRLDDRTMYKQSFESFTKSGLADEIVLYVRDRYEADAKTSKPHVVNGITVAEFASKLASGTFIVPSQVNPKIEAIMYMAYKMPTSGGFPLRYVKYGGGYDFLSGSRNSRSKVEVLLSTFEIKKLTEPSEFFDCPAHFKAVSSMQDVMLAKGKRSDSDEIFRDLTGK
jgi:hypothetical protein